MKRWDSDQDGAMDEYDDGGFVKYEDAAELQRQLDEAEVFKRQWAETDRALVAANLAAAKLQRQLDEVTRERDTARAMLALADERINRLLGGGREK